METQKTIAVDEFELVPQPATHESTVIAVLFALTLSNLLNDVFQSLISVDYPLLKTPPSVASGWERASREITVSIRGDADFASRFA